MAMDVKNGMLLFIVWLVLGDVRFASACAPGYSNDDLLYLPMAGVESLGNECVFNESAWLITAAVAITLNICMLLVGINEIRAAVYASPEEGSSGSRKKPAKYQIRNRALKRKADIVFYGTIVFFHAAVIIRVAVVFASHEYTFIFSIFTFLSFMCVALAIKIKFGIIFHQVLQIGKKSLLDKYRERKRLFIAIVLFDIACFVTIFGGSIATAIAYANRDIQSAIAAWRATYVAIAVEIMSCAYILLKGVIDLSNRLRKAIERPQDLSFLQTTVVRKPTTTGGVSLSEDAAARKFSRKMSENSSGDDNSPVVGRKPPIPVEGNSGVLSVVANYMQDDSEQQQQNNNATHSLRISPALSPAVPGSSASRYGAGNQGSGVINGLNSQSTTAKTNGTTQGSGVLSIVIGNLKTENNHASQPTDASIDAIDVHLTKRYEVKRYVQMLLHFRMFSIAIAVLAVVQVVLMLCLASFLPVFWFVMLMVDLMVPVTTLVCCYFFMTTKRRKAYAFLTWPFCCIDLTHFSKNSNSGEQDKEHVTPKTSRNVTVGGKGDKIQTKKIMAGGFIGGLDEVHV